MNGMIKQNEESTSAQVNSLKNEIEILERRLKHKDILLEDYMQTPWWVDGPETLESFNQKTKLIEAVKLSQEHEITILELT